MFLDNTAWNHAGQDHDEAQEDEDDAQVEGCHHGLRLVGRRRPDHCLLLQCPRAGHTLTLGADDRTTSGCGRVAATFLPSS